MHFPISHPYPIPNQRSFGKPNQAVCRALDALCDQALSKQGFAWGRRPQYEAARWVPARTAAEPTNPAAAEAKPGRGSSGRGQPAQARTGPPVAEAKAAGASMQATLKVRSARRCLSGVPPTHASNIQTH